MWLKDDKSQKTNQDPILKVAILRPRASYLCSLSLSFPTRKWEVGLEEHSETSSSNILELERKKNRQDGWTGQLAVGQTTDRENVWWV